MRLLLDTHSLLWYITDDERLSEDAKRAISTAENKVFLSVGSLWEIAIKHGLGKLDLPKPFHAFMAEQLAENRIEVLPISFSHLAKYTELPLHHRDPFDRLIIAQALTEGMPVISVDKNLPLYPVTVIW